MTQPVTLPPEIPRDHWGRPLVVPPGGGARVPYTRTTTFVGTLEDRYALGKWQQRMVAIGLADRKDLLLAASAHRDDKTKLDAICEDALEAAKGKAAATTGTALHALTEQFDRGLEPIIPEDYVEDLSAYARATADFQAVQIEQFCVQDPLKVGGTPDRVVKYQGNRYIADLKTGSIEYGYLSIAAQLAMYARSRPYSVKDDERMEPHGAEIDRGIVIHLPAGQGICTLYWIDLMQGWELVKLARDIRVHRQLRFPQLLRELSPAPVAPVTLADRIKVARTRDEVEALWRGHASEWDDRLTDLARQHIAALAPNPTPERNPA